METENITKKQHYVPKFYLKGFTNTEGNLHILDVANNRLCQPTAPSGVGYKPFFYGAETGVADDTSQIIEKWLQQYEDILASMLPNIIEKILTAQHIDDDDRYALSVLMNMLWLRSPNMRKQLQKMEEEMTKNIMRFSAAQDIERFNEATEQKLSPKDLADLKNTIETGSYTLRFNNAQHLRLLTKELNFGGPGFANMFFGQKWKIYIAKGKKRFITSDSPVVEWCLPPKGFYGASFLERQKFFPLTPEIFIELSYPNGSEKVKRETIFESDDDKVSILNILTAAYSHGFAYSKEKALLETLVAGRKNPGKLEQAYYQQYELPWENARKLGHV